MTLRDNFHSKAVAWLKVALPLIALGILSTLFLVSSKVDPEATLPGAQAGIAERVREPRLTRPIWSGVTGDGAALTVTADEARPEAGGTGAGTGGASAQALRARLELPDGGHVLLVADRGRMEPDGSHMTVTGSVVVTTSTGYRIETETLEAQMDQSALRSDTAVTATGPAGRLTAGTMHLTGAPGRSGSYVVVFNGGVRLLYQPESATP